MLDKDRFQDLAALDALGLLDQDEAKALAAAFTEGGDAAHLEEELTAYRETAAALACRLSPVPPKLELFDRIAARIDVLESARPGVEILAGQGKWRELGIPGVTMKMLYRDPAAKTNTILLRLEPGASYPAHHHHDNEQCWLLEGDMRWNDLVYKKGDFIVAMKGSTHPAISTANGALLLLIAGHSEFVAG